MYTTVISDLSAVPADDWDALVNDGYPFLQHAFLHALEAEGCLGERSGWYPQHILCYAADDRLIGAMPLYIKDNSFGEFVFDWSWADAYQRHGLDYYPKLVSAIPFTPATGARLLIHRSAQRDAVAQALLQRAMTLSRELHCSSLHWLFTVQADLEQLSRAGCMTRVGCQFHWHNPGYREFGDYLAALTAKKRKNIRHERRQAQASGLTVRVVTGTTISDAEWHAFHRFYLSTFHKRGNFPALTLDFFRRVGVALGDRVVLVLAERSGRPVAGALSYASDTSLYGRHWGCLTEYDSLHFELCYYQGIEYCIQRRLQRFEPGAQGEHKIWRGFLPTLTYSAHWLIHPAFRTAVADFLARETPAVQEYARELAAHSPYRNAGDSAQ